MLASLPSVTCTSLPRCHELLTRCFLCLLMLINNWTPVKISSFSDLGYWNPLVFSGSPNFVNFGLFFWTFFFCLSRLHQLNLISIQDNQTFRVSGCARWNRYSRARQWVGRTPNGGAHRLWHRLWQDQKVSCQAGLKSCALAFGEFLRRIWYELCDNTLLFLKKFVQSSSW